jgi:serine/threonine-protein kinase RsbW
MESSLLAQSISFPTKTENISLVEKMIDEVCAELNVKEDYYGNILIAMTEAVNNAMCHGNKMISEKSVTVSFEQKDNRLAFLVEDEGPGFDYDKLPDPTDPENIEKPNGRGVFLMKHLADEVKFLDEGKRVELLFSISYN